MLFLFLHCMFLLQSLQIFSKPHPFIFNLSSVLLPGFVTLLIIGLLAPFGFQQMGLFYRTGFAFMLGLIASLSVLIITSLLKKLYPSCEDSWTVGKEILLILSIVITISFFIYLIFQYLDITDVKSFTLFKMVFTKTILVSILPIIILVLFEQYNHQKKQAKTAEEMRATLPIDKSSALIQLHSENGSLEVQLHVDELIYLKADGNYVEVFYMDLAVQKRLIRNRLKVLFDKLPKDTFFHCHKSYIVNKQNILSVTGNARNFELAMRGVDIQIPVSRTKSEELKSFLASTS